MRSMRLLICCFFSCEFSCSCCRAPEPEPESDASAAAAAIGSAGAEAAARARVLSAMLMGEPVLYVALSSPYDS